jgi:hypothetical protein
MPFTLDRVVPWGRSFDEYARMFRLTEAELSGRLLGCGDGPASFNAEATARGCRVVSCDPIYEAPAGAIEQRVRETCDQILDQVRRNQADFVWTTIPSPEALGEIRMSAMRRFLQDYPAGRTAGRYVTAALPKLPFRDNAFDLALCSHFLFLYSQQLSLEFHGEAAAELCRVAREVRIFPLFELGGRESDHVRPIIEQLQRDGCRVRREKVAYEFQRGGDTALFISTE